MDLTIFSYFNVAQVAMLVDGVSAIAKNNDYLDLLKVIIMAAFLVLVARIAIGKGGDPFEFFKWLICVALILWILVFPKVNVVIVDRTGTTPPTARSNVPLGFAFFASITSHGGDYLTRAFETVFAMPTDLQFQKNGVMFGNTVVSKSLTTRAETEFHSDLTNFINSCTYFDITAGRITETALKTSDNLWETMSNTSLALTTKNSKAASGSMTCDAAYRNITTRFPAVITDTTRRDGMILNPSAISKAAAGAPYESQLTTSYTALTAISHTAVDLLRQNMVANAVRDSQMTEAQRLDSGVNAIVAQAQTEAENASNINYLTMARVAERAAPAIRNTVEIICYAVFPLIVIMLLIAPMESGPILKNYVLTLVWIQIIPALYAVLNFVMTSASSLNLKGIVLASDVAGVTLQNIGQLAHGGISDQAIAGMLSLSIPLIAWAVVKTGEVGGAALFNAALAGAGSAAASSAGNLASGNINQGMVSVEQHTLAPQTTAGFSRVTNAGGSTTYGYDGTMRHQLNQSSLGFTASTGQKIANSFSSEAAKRSEVAARESTAATESKSSALTHRMAVQKAWSDQQSSGNATDIAQSTTSGRALSELNSIATQVSQSLGKNGNLAAAQQIMGVVAMNGGGSVDFSGLAKAIKKNTGLDIPIGLNAGMDLTNSTISSGTKGQDLGSAVKLAQDLLKSKSFNAHQALNDDFKSSQSYQWGQQHRSESVKAADAAQTDANMHSHNAEIAQSEAFSLSSQARLVTENWATSAMSYEGYVAKRLEENGQLAAYNMLYQSNPDAAAKLASQYVRELVQVMPPTPMLANSLPEVQTQSPELAGRSIESETARMGTPQDLTASHYGQARAAVRKDGFATPAVRNSVGAQVQQHRTEAETTVNAGGATIAQERKAADAAARAATDPTKFVTGNPNPADIVPGSAADQLRKAHTQLTGEQHPPAGGKQK